MSKDSIFKDKSLSIGAQKIFSFLGSFFSYFFS